MINSARPNLGRGLGPDTDLKVSEPGVPNLVLVEL